MLKDTTSRPVWGSNLEPQIWSLMLYHQSTPLPLTWYDTMLYNHRWMPEARGRGFVLRKNKDSVKQRKELSRLMGKPTIRICENKDADQLRGNRKADHRLCFSYTDSILPLLFKSEISSFQSASVTVQPDLCRTGSETTLLVFHEVAQLMLDSCQVAQPFHIHISKIVFFHDMANRYTLQAVLCMMM